jgi:hypothetical protein
MRKLFAAFAAVTVLVSLYVVSMACGPRHQSASATSRRRGRQRVTVAFNPGSRGALTQ